MKGKKEKITMKTITGIILAIIMVFTSGVSFFAADNEVYTGTDAAPPAVTLNAGVLTYTQNGLNVTITGCAANATSAQVHAAFEQIAGSGYIVTAIGAQAFQNCIGLTNLTLPDTLTTIAARAFWGSSLSSVVIPETLTKVDTYYNQSWKGPFANASSLTTVTFAGQRASIPADVLRNSSSVSSVVIPNTVTVIGNNAFEGTSLETVPWPSSLQTINNEAFMNMKLLKSVTLPNTVTSIGRNAFSGCSMLNEVYLSNSLQSIGGGAFWETNLTTVTIPTSLTKVDTAYNQSWKGPFANIPSLTTVIFEGQRAIIPADMLRNTSSVSSVVIPNTVSSIGNNAFEGTSLETVPWPSSLHTVGNSAFMNMKRLKTVTLPNTVINIGRDAFSGCSMLSEVYLSNSLQSIGGGAFWETNLVTVTIPASLTKVDTAHNQSWKGPFANTPSLETVYFAPNAGAIPDNILLNTTYVRTVYLSRHSVVGKDAFTGMNPNIVFIYYEDTAAPQITNVTMYKNGIETTSITSGDTVTVRVRIEPETVTSVADVYVGSQSNPMAWKVGSLTFAPGQTERISDPFSITNNEQTTYTMIYVKGRNEYPLTINVNSGDQPPQHGWVFDGTYWYYYQNDTPCTGWIQDGAWYFLDYETGRMVTGWMQDPEDGKWYYLNPTSGAMHTGWLLSGGTWYFMNGGGDMREGEWLNYGGQWYYLAADSGAMLTGGPHTIDGETYFFDPSGAWIP